MQVVYVNQADVDNRPDSYNTAFHRVSEHPAFAAEILDPYDENATDYGKWLSIIAASQNINDVDIQRIILDRYIVQTMLDGATGSIITGKVLFQTCRYTFRLLIRHRFQIILWKKYKDLMYGSKQRSNSIIDTSTSPTVFFRDPMKFLPKTGILQISPSNHVSNYYNI
ncbi:MAG: hypothetical protein EOP45_18675 [Sphingobacteriaceae bacterium]|nr:MAG: hypothetical protein EOP45_18675 [Sphingobacteriaceae bacterium]